MQTMDMLPSPAGSYDGQRGDIILLVCLGSGGYQRTIYETRDNGKTRVLSESGYVFDAIVSKEKPNKMLFIGTSGSGWKSLMEWYGKAENADVSMTDLLKETQEGDLYAKYLGAGSESSDLLCRDMEKYIEAKAGFEKVKTAIVPFGLNGDEHSEYFETLRAALDTLIDKGRRTNIILDVSNGFRSIPLFIMVLVKYITLIRRQEIRFSAYYGMFEAKTKDEDGTFHTPLVDLQLVADLTDWVNAISEFQNFGSVKMLIRCLEREQWLENEKDKKGHGGQIGQMIQALRQLEYGSNSNNLYYLQESIEFLSAVNVGSMDFLSEASRMMLKTVVSDFGRRYDRFTAYRGREKDHPFHYAYFQLRLAEMYCQQGKYSAASIALGEGVTTYMLEQYDPKAVRYLKEIRETEGEEGYVKHLFNFAFRDNPNNRKSSYPAEARPELTSCWGKWASDAGGKDGYYSGKYGVDFERDFTLQMAFDEKDHFGLELLLNRIKVMLRNVGAHGLYGDYDNSTPTGMYENLGEQHDYLQNIEQWLSVSVNSILKDMNRHDQTIKYQEDKPALPFRLYEYYGQADRKKLWNGV